MLEVDIALLDRDPMRINVLNGTIVVARDIEGGFIRLDPHDPGDCITRLAPVVYDPEAACPLYAPFSLTSSLRPKGAPSCTRGSATRCSATLASRRWPSSTAPGATARACLSA